MRRSLSRCVAAAAVFIFAFVIYSARPASRVSTILPPPDSKRAGDSTDHYRLPFGSNPFAPSEVRTTTGSFISADKFIPASYCARCHADAHRQWQESPHRNSFREPFYKKNVELFIDQYGIEYTRHCEGCHNPVALVSGALTKGSKLARPFDEEGVTCTVCHSIERVTWLEGIGSYELRPPALLLDENGKPWRGEVRDKTILANVDAHRRAMMKDFYKTPEFCAVCHKSALPREIENYKWRRAFSAYDEWQMSSHSNESPLPFYKKPRNTCQSCHMKPEEARSDLAATQGKIASHRWPASNTAIPHFYGFKDQEQAVIDFLKAGNLSVDIFTLKKGPAYPTQREATDLITLRKGVAGINLVNGFTAISIIDAALYPGHLKPDETVIAPIDKQAFTIEPDETVTVGVVISNRGVGHFFPTELRDFFEPWVEFKVEDRHGRSIYHSGFLKPNGAVDDRAHVFQSVQVTEEGQWVRRHNIWETRGKAYDNYIAPGRSELIRYQFTIPKQTAGGLRITARVLYRKFNRYFSDWALGKSLNYPVVEMAGKSVALNVGENRPAVTILDQDDLIRFNNLGIALLDQLMFADARRAFEKTTAINPAYDDGYVNQALATSWTDFGVMHELLDRSLALSPTNARALYYKGALLRMAGKPADALELFKQIEPRFPRDRMTLNQMGECYRALGRPADARAAFERVLAIDPDDITALYYIVDAYRQTGAAEIADKTNLTYLDRFEDWRIHYLANEYIKRDEVARVEAVPWHVHADVDMGAATNADPIYWTSEGVPKKKESVKQLPPRPPR
ncbi:MAG TPA: tetratricopeptide repeat protein [Blastocatellia bacterium]|nr:tetratricopeptide repeat protein [Blastocatellia bacterium]